ncbi:hypothetical protein [Arthrobacter sp. H16F315]|uniref:hypothetical protein n=1 Tax=Arthrobacter sp. H16F315 TaxID=2955314 RepID=UPI002097BA06|nr:hypothetical protein [Arthrobacter sp. H16F315]MDD1477843.1 hypothetical protein [Arthrobacter sp. H16F315]
MITQNRNPTTSGSYSTTSGTAEIPLTGRYAAFGRYTAVDTLVRGDARRIVRPGSYTEVDTLTRPKSDIVRTGSYADMDTLTRPKSDIVRTGSYADMMLP